MSATSITDADLTELPEVAPTRPAKSLSRRIVSGGAWSIAGRMGSMGCLFLMNVLLARHLVKAEYSAFLAAASVMPFLAMLATMGVPFTVVRALRGQISGPVNSRAILRGAMMLTLMGSAVTGVGLYFAAEAFPEEAKWQLLRHAPGLMIAWFTLSAISIVCACFLQGLDDFRSAALIGARSGGLIPNGLATAAVAVAAWAGVLTLVGVMTVNVVGYVVALVVAALVIRAWLSRTEAQVANDSSSAFPTDASSPSYSAGWYLMESWPNLVNQLIAVALIEMDLFWVTCLAPEEMVADYGVVRNLRLLVTAPLLIASVSLAPFVAELFGKGDFKRLERLLRGTATLIAAPSLAAMTVLLVMPQTVIRWTFGADFVQAGAALSIASIGCIIFVISGSNALVLTMTGRHRDLMVCSLFSLGLYLAISPLLISRYGVLGAAVAFTVQTAVQNVMVTLRVKQTTGLWTTPLCSPSAVRQEAAELRRRFMPKK